ncbi:tetratricopeptide repeat protein [Arenimonas daejeonensis]|uniref:tetratricopeptide repeat protein n=1 Tax=Arenimonas daejeonensis TaxID=370777 RepID=UPI0013156022|nr:tetratricopeptide repeat protein [Arenimonas daejeonensis]
MLPFENLSSDPDNAYFATGIQDEILTRLSKIGALKVISRTSTMNIASKPANLPEIAAMLGVSTVLEGSVQKSGNTVRINVQLIRAATDEHLWAESYDRQLDDVFAVQGEVARAVADALSAALTGAESDALNVAPTTNTKAYEFYLRGLALEARYTNVQEEIAERADAYRKAVELDASFALAWANLSGALTEMYFNERTDARKADARNALDHALSLAPEAAETWSALAIYRYFVERDYDGAFEAYSKALAQRPNDGLIVYSMGNVRRRQGRWDDAVALQQRGTEMDPLATNTWFNYGMTLRALRRYDEAQAAFDRGLAAVPGDPELVIQKLVTFGASGDLAGGNNYVRTLSADALLDPGIAQAVAFGHLLQRDFPAALAVLEAVLARADPLSERDRNQTQVALAGVQLAMGDREAGLAGMRAVRDRLQSVVDSGNTSPYLLSLLASVYAELGDKATSYRLANEAVEGLRADALGLPGGLETKAFVHMLGGDKAEAVALIRQAQSLPMVYGPTPALLRNDPIWDDLRGEPGFEELTRDGAVPLQTGGPR